MKKSILITGGAKRIGSIIAKHFAQHNWHVIIHYNQSKNAAEDLANEINALGQSAQIIGFDLEEIDKIDDIIKNLCAENQNLIAVINNASIFEYDDARKLDLNVFSRAIKINCLAPIKIIQAFKKYAKNTNIKTIINLIDQKLENPNPDFFSYTISKSGLSTAAKMFAIEYENCDFKIFNIAPGISLPSGDQTNEDFKASANLNLLKIENEAISIAKCAYFICSRHLKTGQTFFIDSGQHLIEQKRDVMFLARGNN